MSNAHYLSPRVFLKSMGPACLSAGDCECCRDAKKTLLVGYGGLQTRNHNIMSTNRSDESDEKYESDASDENEASNIGTRRAKAEESASRLQPASSCVTACGMSSKSVSREEAGTGLRGAFSTAAMEISLGNSVGQS